MQWEKRMKRVYSYEEKMFTDNNDTKEADKQTSNLFSYFFRFARNLLQQICLMSF